MDNAQNRLKNDWEDLGEMDPLYAVLSHEDKKNGKWNEQEFFATGKREVAALMERAAQLGFPREKKSALDFGCGVGRLTRALADFFDRVTGVDISGAMILTAKKLNANFPNVDFFQNTQPDLALFPDDAFDLIYSSIVLQHVPDAETRKKYLAEFIRVLKPGGLAAFQIPVRIPWRSRLQPQQRLYRFLRALGVSASRLYRWNLLPISMSAMGESDIQKIVTSAGGHIIAVDQNTFSGPSVDSRMFFATKG